MDNPEKKATLDTRHILKINKTKTKIKKKNNMEPQKTMVNSGVVISLYLYFTKTVSEINTLQKCTN
jgi:hypothetical protein